MSQNLKKTNILQKSFVLTQFLVIFNAKKATIAKINVPISWRKTLNAKINVAKSV